MNGSNGRGRKEDGRGAGAGVDGMRGVCCWCAVMCCLAQWGNRRAALCNPALPSLAWPFDTVATWPPVFCLDQYLWTSSCLIFCFCVGVLSIDCSLVSCAKWSIMCVSSIPGFWVSLLRPVLYFCFYSISSNVFLSFPRHMLSFPTCV